MTTIPSLSRVYTVTIIFYLHQNVIRNHVFIPIVYTDNDFRSSPSLVNKSKMRILVFNFPALLRSN